MNLVEYFIKDCHLDATSKTNGGYTALHVACQKGHINIVRYLVEECNVDLHITTNVGDTACMIACDFERNEIADYLLMREHEKTTQNVRIVENCELQILNVTDHVTRYDMAESEQLFPNTMNDSLNEVSTTLVLSKKERTQYVCIRI